MSTCSSCGGSGRGTVVNSGGLPEYGGTCNVCGGSGTIRDTHTDFSGTPQRRGEGSSDSDPVESTITLIVIAVWLGGWYYLTGHIGMVWYWGLGISFLTGLLFNYLLKGPLYGLITFLVNTALFVMGVAFLLFVAALIFKVFSE